MLHRRDGELYRYQEFTRFDAANEFGYDVHLKEGCRVDRGKRVPLASAFIKWPFRVEVDGLDYDTGEPPLKCFMDSNGKNVFNIWKGLPVKPKKGNVRPFIDYVDQMLGVNPKIERDYILDCLAWPLQNPGKRSGIAVVLYGPPGTGKSTLGECLRTIYGENFIKIGKQEMLSGDFNEWQYKRQVIFCEEAFANEKKAFSGFLKEAITQTEVSINIKMKSLLRVKDCSHWFFCSNHPYAVFMDKDDRRFFVQRVTDKKIPKETFKKLYQWLKSPEGPPALLHYLQHRKINPNRFIPGRAMMTAAKEVMIREGLSALALELDHLRKYLEDFTLMDKPFAGNLVTADELRWYMAKKDITGYDGKPLSAHMVSRMCGQQGWSKAYGGASIKVTFPNGETSNTMYWILRQPERWKKADHGACKKDIIRARGGKRVKN